MQPKLGELKEQGIDLYVVAIGKEDELKEIFTENEVEATVIYDAGAKIHQQFRALLPETLYVDREGRVAAVTLGWGPGALEMETLPLIEAILEE